MRIILVICYSILISACSETEWTEGYYYPGFKNKYETKIIYDIGGYTKLTVNASSKMFNELKYPLTLNILLNDKVCLKKTISNASKELLFSEFCEVNLGSGTHNFKAYVVSPNNFINITEKKDWDENELHGSLIYTLEE